MEDRAHMVEGDGLMEALWQESFVTEANLVFTASLSQSYRNQCFGNALSEFLWTV
ncbi:MAG: hypothetical protein IT174_11475 [Acidobacteria bacterium]|nr:hypothetical protein [Acidobacteriota bacterium]